MATSGIQLTNCIYLSLKYFLTDQIRDTSFTGGQFTIAETIGFDDGTKSRQVTNLTKTDLPAVAIDIGADVPNWSQLGSTAPKHFYSVAASVYSPDDWSLNDHTDVISEFFNGVTIELRDYSGDDGNGDFPATGAAYTSAGKKIGEMHIRTVDKIPQPFLAEGEAYDVVRYNSRVPFRLTVHSTTKQ